MTTNQVPPKIEANVKVVKNIDPFNEKAYQVGLTKGVAHARGTALPGHAGNTFIFAHSSGNWYEANRYNSIFYLLHRLKKDRKKIVEAGDVKYLENTNQNTSTVTLMTCWPPGTTLKRLIVRGEIVAN